MEGGESPRRLEAIVRFPAAAWLRDRPALLVSGACLAQALATLAFVSLRPAEFVGVSAALVTLVSVTAAVIGGMRIGLGVAAVGGVLFLIEVAFRFEDTAFAELRSLPAVPIFLAAALIAGTVAERLRERVNETVGELAAREQQVRSTVEAAAAALGLFGGPELRCRAANAGLRALAEPGVAVAGTPIGRLLPGLPADVVTELSACIRGELERVERAELALSDAVFALSARRLDEPDEPALLLTFADVTASAESRGALERVLAMMPSLHAAGTPDTVAGAICSAALGSFGCDAVSLWGVEGADARPLAAAPELPPGSAFPVGDEQTLRTDVIEGRRLSFEREDVAGATEGSGDSLDLRAVLRVPIQVEARVAFVLVLGWRRPAKAPSPSVTLALLRFADQAALALEQARRRDVEQSAEALQARLQAGLLPTLDIRDRGVAVLARYRAGEHRLLLGGDFYDVIESPGGSLSVLIGDVSGHGAAAAALGASLRAAWRGLILAGVDASAALTALEDLIRRERLSDEVFATVCTGGVDPARRRLTVTCAGHPPPIVVLDDHAGVADVAPGPALGVLEGARWTAATVDLPDDWVLLLYTDGLVEGYAEPGSRERFGVERLLERVARLSPASSPLDAGTLDRLLADIQAANGGPLADDVAVLVLTGGRPRSVPGGEGDGGVVRAAGA
jgi:serine phosphatase RsbU (regulator of sigma subunit)